MEKDHKILISAILIIGIAIFASSLNDGISGRVSASCTEPSAVVSPNVIAAGESVKIDVKGYFYSPVDIIAEDGRLIETITRPCKPTGGYVCDNGGSFEIKTLGRESSNLWQDGTYCIKAKTCEKTGGLRDREIITGSCFQVKCYINKWGNKIC